MNRSSYERLVRRLERTAERWPLIYHLTVLCWSALGYCYLVGAMAVVAVISGGLAVGAWERRDVAALVVALVVASAEIPFLRAMWVRVAEPGGLEVTPTGSPEIWHLVEDLQKKLGTRPIQKIFVTTECNASIAQHPRFGLLGGYRNYLTVGMPLLLSLDREQLGCVIAHELGHLSRKSARVTTWVFRTRLTWERLAQVWPTIRWGTVYPVAVFANWYMPRLSARSAVMSRRLELEADRATVIAVGSGPAASTLLAMEVRTWQVDRFWSRLDRTALDNPQAPASIVSDMVKALAEPPDEARVRLALRRAMALRTEDGATHPCLRERLAAVGYPGVPAEITDAVQVRALADGVALPAPGSEALAREMLGRDFHSIVVKIEALWRGYFADQWFQRHQALLESRRRLDELTEKAPSRPETVADLADLAERVRLVEQLEGGEAALEYIDGLAARSGDGLGEARPGCALLEFVWGRLLLQYGDDDRGLAMIDRAIALDVEAVEPGLNVLYGRYVTTGRHEEAKAVLARYDKLKLAVELAKRDRTTIRPADRFVPHGLTSAEIERIVRILAGQKKVARAWLARKPMSPFSDTPEFCLVVERRTPGWQVASTTAHAKAANELVRRLSTERPMLIWVMDRAFPDPSGILARFAKMPEHQIFPARREMAPVAALPAAATSSPRPVTAPLAPPPDQGRGDDETAEAKKEPVTSL